jgi:hypothetical protein
VAELYEMYVVYRRTGKTTRLLAQNAGVKCHSSQRGALSLVISPEAWKRLHTPSRAHPSLLGRQPCARIRNYCGFRASTCIRQNSPFSQWLTQVRRADEKKGNRFEIQMEVGHTIKDASCMNEHESRGARNS